MRGDATPPMASGSAEGQAFPTVVVSGGTHCSGKVGAVSESTKLDTNNNEAFTGVALMENGLEVLLPNKLATSLVTYRRLS